MRCTTPTPGRYRADITVTTAVTGGQPGETGAG